MTTQLARAMALFGYFGLMLWVILWHGIISPAVHVSIPIMLAFWLIWLLIPIRGMIKGNPYTHAWSVYLLLPYFIHSSSFLLQTDELWLALVELALASTMFIGNMYYAKLRGRELGLSIRRKKTES